MTTNRRVRWGVIGSGGIARRRTVPEGIVPAVNAELATVFDPDREANQTVARQYEARAAESVEELLAGDVDAVYVASPPAAHRAQVAACARAGKGVLCEKPLALTVADAEAMVAECAGAAVPLGVGFMMRFVAQHQAALRMIREGQLGRPVFARAQLSCWYPPLLGAWRQDPRQSGGGALMDLGGHCLDLLEMFLGEAVAVTCMTTRAVHDYPVEDGAVVSLQFPGGVLGVVDVSFSVPDASSRNRLEIYGTAGSILAEGTIGQAAAGEMRAHLGAEGRGYDAVQARSGGGGPCIAPPAVNPYRAQIEEFSQALLEGRAPLNDAALGLQSQRLIAACYESAATGRLIRLT